MNDKQKFYAIIDNHGKILLLEDIITKIYEKIKTDIQDWDLKKYYIVDYEHVFNKLFHRIYFDKIIEVKIVKNEELEPISNIGEYIIDKNKVKFSEEYTYKDFKWFDKDCCDWEKDSYLLALHYFDKFKIWFDKDKFNYFFPELKNLNHNNGTYVLIINCSKYFDQWFDADKIDWHYAHYFPKFFPKKFKKWFLPGKFVFNDLIDFFIFVKYIALDCIDYYSIWRKWLKKGNYKN